MNSFLSFLTISLVLLSPSAFTWSELYPVTSQKQRTAELPAMNAAVLEFVNANMGKRIGRGECWDVAAKALDSAGATWDGNYVFGKMIDPKKTDILPGDIIQFEGVEAVIETEHSTTTERMGHHTAIIQAVKDGTQLTLAHQNYGRSGRKVGLTELDLNTIVKGDFTVFRPVR